MLIIKWEVMAHFTAKLITTLNKITNIWETAFRSCDVAEKKKFTLVTSPHSHAANAKCVDVEFYTFANISQWCASLSSRLAL